RNQHSVLRGKFGRWPQSRRRGRSCRRGGGPPDNPALPCPPGAGCGRWRPGWPRPRRSTRCWRSRAGPSACACCPRRRVGHNGGCVGMAAAPIPVSLHGFGVQGGGHPKVFTHAVQQETSHPQVVRHLYPLARAHLELPLPGRG
ncbi:hypothetical protein SKAU_G00362500, partial [Synaphobranchus kaupii]